MNDIKNGSRKRKSYNEPIVLFSSDGEPRISALGRGGWRRPTGRELVLYSRAAHLLSGVRQEG